MKVKDLRKMIARLDQELKQQDPNEVVALDFSDPEGYADFTYGDRADEVTDGPISITSINLQKHKDEPLTLYVSWN